jgi:hypothetical protein
MRELLVYARVGYYHRYDSHPADPGLFDPAAIKPQAEAAFQAFAASPHYNDFTPDGGQIASEWIIAIDTGKLWHGFYGKFVAVVSDYWNQPPRQPDWYQQYNVYSVFYAFERAVFDLTFQPLVDAAFIALVKNYAVNTMPAPGAAYLVGNAIHLLGTIGQHIDGLKPACIAALNDAFAAHPHLSEPWLWAVDALCKLGACPTENGQIVTKEDAAAELEAQLFPNTYTFDDGAIVVRTPMALDPIQALYHAIKEVAAQFNRVTRTIPPLPGDPNGVLTIKIYGSQAEYQTYHPFLTGLPTNNGGIYYEQKGTFYTFDRPPTPGNYTLEELTRHEYAHYLSARFISGGLWGEAPIYDNDRMVWFDEGFAEFLTGSAATGGIKPRKHLADMVAADGLNRMSVAQVLASTYGNFIFYRYAGFFFLFMYSQRRDLLRQFIDYVRAAGPDPNDPDTIAAITAPTRPISTRSSPTPPALPIHRRPHRRSMPSPPTTRRRSRPWCARRGSAISPRPRSRPRRSTPASPVAAISPATPPTSPTRTRRGPCSTPISRSCWATCATSQSTTSSGRWRASAGSASRPAGIRSIPSPTITWRDRSGPRTACRRRLRRTSRPTCTARGSAAERPAPSSTGSSTARCRFRRRLSRRQRQTRFSITSSKTDSTSCAPSSTRSIRPTTAISIARSAPPHRR